MSEQEEQRRSHRQTKNKYKKRKTENTNGPNPIYYIGYVEDEETPEEIMRKFEELEKLKKEVSKNKNTTQQQDTGIKSIPLDEDTEMIDMGMGDVSYYNNHDKIEEEEEDFDKMFEELTGDLQEEIFKRTSSFGIQQMISINQQLAKQNKSNLWVNEYGYLDGMDEEEQNELFFGQQDGIDADADKDVEFIINEEDLLALDDDEYSKLKKKRNKLLLLTGQKRGGQQRNREKSEIVGDAVRELYSILENAQRRFGFLKKKQLEHGADEQVSSVETVRLPFPKLPISWGKTIEPLQSKHCIEKICKNGSRILLYSEANETFDTCLQTSAEEDAIVTSLVHQASMAAPEGSTIHTTHIHKFDFTTLFEQEGRFEAILIDPIYNTSVMEVLQSIPLQNDQLFKRGFVFIWIEKEYICSVADWLHECGLEYVENATWVKHGINNEFVMEEYPVLKKSKLTLFIFKKESKDGNKIQIRHQRNPDVLLDFMREDAREKPMNYVYRVIETLLAESLKKGKCLEIYGNAKIQVARRGWTRICEKSEIL